MRLLESSCWEQLGSVCKQKGKRPLCTPCSLFPGPALLGKQPEQGVVPAEGGILTQGQSLSPGGERGMQREQGGPGCPPEPGSAKEGAQGSGQHRRPCEVGPVRG